MKIYEDPEAVEALQSIQNFYDSFCTSETEYPSDENLVDDLNQQMQPVPDDDEDNPEIFLSTIFQNSIL